MNRFLSTLFPANNIFSIIGGYMQVGNAVEAAGHAALCITEELWTLSGVGSASNLVESLAKVLKSLALPEDQVDRSEVAAA